MLRRVGFLLLWVFLLANVPAVFAQDPAGFITFPAAGDAVQGAVSITGSSEMENFLSAELAYAYQDGPEDGWFLISQSKAPVKEGELGVWDTTTIADGTYRLRLRVHRKDGSLADTLVDGVRVRNYSPVETRAPAAVKPGVTSQPPTETPAPARLLPTPTHLPENPARLTEAGLAAGLKQGVILAVLLFAAFGVYAGIRSLLRGR